MKRRLSVADPIPRRIHVDTSRECKNNCQYDQIKETQHTEYSNVNS